MAAVETRARRDGSTAYRVFWRDPNDGSRRSMTFDDKGEAERAATLLNANGQHLSLAIDVAKAIRQDGPTVDDVVEEHITLLMRVGDDTRAGYRLRARDHISPHIGQLRVASLTWQQVTRWVQLLQDKGLSTKTIANVHGLLSAAMNTAVRLEYRKDNPCSAIRLPRTQRGGDEMVVLEPSELDLILDQLAAPACSLAPDSATRRSCWLWCRPHRNGRSSTCSSPPRVSVAT
ncbi:hypothetical protein [Cellulomonas sp. ATA003]|uniref:hypothetical protein n=1 Tax=Cellulomonas sp. ATA003 TaxID=3073064 RepID=UPI0028735C84|nr:hypothetical protein [Cellulomonas sp. ATA003]WNB87008.1 hypothetical protein REH70_07655 [Cellulomonas sp. ATA003]